MITEGLDGVEFVAVNTDAQSLAQSLAEKKVNIGLNITRGL
jgi:cell division protein FtsZ